MWAFDKILLQFSKSGLVLEASSENFLSSNMQERGEGKLPTLLNPESSMQ
jgi:hypothetical protein